MTESRKNPPKETGPREAPPQKAGPLKILTQKASPINAAPQEKGTPQRKGAPQGRGPRAALLIAQSGMIAALYVALTELFAPLSFGEMQIRLSEALTILPAFTPAAIPGLFLGCLIGNLLGGAILLDVAMGSLATLLGAIGTYLLRKTRWLAPIAPIVTNATIVPLVLRYGYGVPLPLPLLMLSVGIGEAVSCGVLGTLLAKALDRYARVLSFHWI